MKLFRITLLLSCVVLLSACIAESRYCPMDREIVLKFEYVYNGYDVFDTQVQNVDLFVFNSSNLLVHRETINAAQLNAFAGTTLTLAPGDYRIVAWGNVSPQNAFGSANVGDHINDAYVGRSAVPRNTAPQPGNGDRLHFAPGLAQQEFILHIPTHADDLTATLPFARSYIGIEVFVVGFNAYTGEAAAPIVEIDGAASHFCFDRVPEGDITLRETTVIQTQYVQRPATAMFRTKLFDDNANFAKELRVRSGQGANAVHFTLETALLRAKMAEFMADNNIHSFKADATPQRVIPITIVFGMDVEVSVTVPVFERVDGNPTF